MNELNHGAGKGDADRSPGWRKNYDEINWGNSAEGFIQHGNKQRKQYGNKKEVTSNDNGV